jgi:hypothetical protein
LESFDFRMRMLSLVATICFILTIWFSQQLFADEESHLLRGFTRDIDRAYQQQIQVGSSLAIA